MSVKYFRIDEDEKAGYTGFANAAHRWSLPGIRRCPSCRATWGDNSKAYPSVDLSSVLTKASFEARAEPIEEYERICEVVRPLLPSGALLEPGTALGPLVGSAEGRFGQFVSNYSDIVLVRREALEQLSTEALSGLKGYRTELRFQQSNPPELLELEILPQGRVHPDCLPPDRQPACVRCGREGLSLPRPLVLNSGSLPPHLDVFRLEDFSTVIVCTERFVDACQRLNLDGIVFQPLAVKSWTPN